MQAPGARPQAHRSCVSAGLWPTLERVFCISPPPCRYSSVATTSASLLPSCSAHQPRPRASHPPLTASRGALPACSVSRARPRACDRLMAAARAMRRCSPHFWVLSMRAETLAVVCGASGMAAAVASEVARRAIARRSERPSAGTRTDAYGRRAENIW